MPTSGVPQLVADVGDEAAQPRLRLGPRREGLLDLAEHPVERGRQAADLGVGGGVRDLRPRSPDAIAAAVSSMARNGRSPP